MAKYSQLTPSSLILTDDTTEAQKEITLDGGFLTVPETVCVQGLYGVIAYDLSIRPYTNQSGGFKTMAGAEILWFDSANGIISMPKQSACRVYLSAAQSIPNATWTKIEFDTEGYDVAGEFDNAVNYRFTATVAGKYLVILNVFVNGVSDGTALKMAIYKNGVSAELYGQDQGSDTPQSFVMNNSNVFNLAANDYLEGYVYQNAGGARDINDGDNDTYMCIIKVA